VRTRALATIVALACACGGDDDAPPPPAELSATLADGATLTVLSDPLTLRVTRDGQTVLEIAQFVEVGVQDGEIDPDVYVDPAAPANDITFHAPARAVTGDAAARRLVLDDGATLTVGADGTLTLDTSGVANAVLARVVLPLAPDEALYGFGMVPDSPATRGVLREMQFRVDTGKESSINELHVPVPLAIAPARGLGVFAAERRVGAFDVGRERAERTLVTFATSTLELHVYGGDAFAILDQYTAASGRPLVPPEWAFLPMQWRNEVSSGQVVLDDAARLRAEDIPGATVWIDNPWQTGYNSFEFLPDRFPDPQGLVDALEAQGFKCLLWSTPYLSPTGTAADFEEARAMGLLVRGPDDRPFLWPWQDGPGALVDFTAPGAIAWWGERVHKVTDLGFAGFKLDFGEDLVPDLAQVKNPVRLHAGTPETLHNLYARFYHEAYLEALPPGDGFLLTRAGTWGEQDVNTCIWPGDLDNDFSRASADNVGGLPAAISNGLSLSASGYPFYGSDIGGFRNGAPTTEALVRWAQYAALGTVMQLGGGGDSHNPWDTTLYGPEALPIYRQYARLHTDLFPYIYSLAVQAGATGRPVTYPVGLVVPGFAYEDAFMLGDALFVAPVVEAGATTRTVTLPPGEWIDWWTGERAQGGGAPVTVPAPLDRLPLWRKVGEIVVLLVTPIDTTLPVTAPGVSSLADPASTAVRVLAAPGTAPASFALYDGGRVDVGPGAVTARAGARHRDFHVEIDVDAAVSVSGLPEVADVTACAAPGCWALDPMLGVLHVRLVLAAEGDEATATFQ
jgi:alpha-glucosidase (family GH31 glycosyl hydrolase)